MSEVKENAERKKQARSGLQWQGYREQDTLDGERNFPPPIGRVWDRIVGSGHNPNVEQKKEGVKKEQEKG